MGALAVAAAAALAALASGAAWFATPGQPLAALALGVVAIAVTVHGLGRLVARAVDDDDAPVALVVAWGFAAWLALGGVLVAVGGFAEPGQRGLALCGTLASAAWCARNGRRLARWRPAPPTVMTAVGAVAVLLVALHTFGSAATTGGAFADGDGFLLGPLARLRSTGQLGDAIGLPRGSGLGGNVVAHSLAAALGDLRAAHAIDRGLGLGLALALILGGAAASRTRPLFALLVLALASATPEWPADLAPRWTVIAAVFAIALGWRRARGPRQQLASVLVAAGLATMIHAGIGVAVALVVMLARGARPARRPAAIAAALALVVVGCYLAVAIAATEPGVPSFLALARRGLLARALGWGFVAAVVHALTRLATRADADRALVVTLAAACAGAAAGGALVPSAGQAWTQVQPLGIALLFLVLEVALIVPERRGRLTPATVVAAALVALVLATTRFPVGWPPRSWEDRLVAQVEAVRTWSRRSMRPDDGPEAAAYRAILADLPRGARIGLWVDRAELIDYRHHRVLDLRSLDGDACSGLPGYAWWRRSPRACRRFAASLAGARLDYLVVSAQAVPRALNWAARPLCLLYRRATCDDPLAALIRRTRAAPLGPLLTVIPLTAPSAPTR